MFKLSFLFFLVAMLAYGVFAAPPGVQEAIDTAKATAAAAKESAQESAASLKAEAAAAKAEADKLKEQCWAAAPEGVDRSLPLLIKDGVCTAGGVSWKIKTDDADA